MFFETRVFALKHDLLFMLFINIFGLVCLYFTLLLLRKHFSMIGHPIIGDKKYNYQNKNKSTYKNLMLHSYEIKFMIKEKKYTFRASLPDYFKKMLKIKRLTFQY